MRLKLFAFLCISLSAGAQDRAGILPHTEFSGFLDVFYAYDFANPENHKRQSFLFNHNRHNEFNLNLGMVRADYKHSGIRASFALQAGTYAQDNYAAEDPVMRHVFEANAGFALNKKQNLWIDAGIMPSHLGFENAVSSKNLTLSRSLVAENSPYFLTGAKLSYLPKENVTLALLVTNGWQQIARRPGFQTPGIGTQVNVELNEKTELNWSTLSLDVTPVAFEMMRFYQNLYLSYGSDTSFQLQVGFDFAVQQTIGDNIYLYVPTVISRTPLTKRLYAAGRIEYYHDPDGMIISPTQTGFEALGYSVHLDIAIKTGARLRFEARRFESPDRVFVAGSDRGNHNTVLLTSLAVEF